MTKFFLNHYYIEHFGEMTSGTKLFKMKKEHVFFKKIALMDQDKPKK